MKSIGSALTGVAVVLSVASFGASAINDEYAEQLERSGCTQVSELQGCDIHKTREENAQAGFGAPDEAEPPHSP